jgi:anti-sigma-K factor RskA
VSEHDKFRELIEPYALGSLDAAERAELEAHLRAGCSECAKALDEARWLVSQLAYLAPETAPSDILKGRVLQRVRSDARSGSGIPFWMWAAVAAVLLFAFYNAWDARQIQKRIQATNQSASAALAEQQKLQEQLAAARREAVILTDPESVKIMLPASDRKMPQLEAMWHEKMGLLVMGHKLPMPSGNRTLQLWLIPKGPGAKPMPSMMLRPDADGNFMLMVSNPPEDMHNTAALAITEEPAGGSAQPTSAPMWLGSVS